MVLLNGRTFAAVTDYRGNEFLLTLPLGSPRWQSSESFTEMFGSPGRALLVSRSPLDGHSLGAVTNREAQTVSGPRLRVVPAIIPVGRIQQERYSAKATLFNDGSEPLIVDRVYASCSCIQTRLSAPTIPAGSSVELEIDGEEKELGPFTYTIIVQAPDAERSQHHVPIHGFLEPPLWLEEPAVTFDPIIEGESAQQQVNYFTLDDVDANALSFEIPEGAPLDIKAVENATEATLVVTWLGSDVPGWHRQEIQIGRHDIAEGTAARLLVAANVIPRAEVRPALLTISPSESKHGWSRRLKVLINDGVDELQEVIIAEDILGDLITVERTTKDRGEVTTVSLSSNSLENLPVSGTAEMEFRLKSGSSLRVPISWGSGGDVQGEFIEETSDNVASVGD